MRRCHPFFVMCIMGMMCVFAAPYAFAAKKSSDGPPPAFVAVTNPVKTTWQDSIAMTGSLASFNGITVKAEAAGRITHIYFSSGQMVKKGDLIIEIFPDIIKAQLKQAEAQLALSKTNYKRFAELLKKGFVTQAEFDSATATLESNQAIVDQFKAQLSQTLIKAPFSGKIGLKLISLGDYVNIGQNIVQLEALDPIEVDFSVPEIYMSQIKVGTKVSLKISAYPKETFDGAIYAINASVDASTRTLDVRASIPNPDSKLLPGTFAEVSMSLGDPITVLTIPQTTIVYDPQGNYVYRVINNHAVKTVITLGKKIADNQIIIPQGLSPNDVVITEGQIKIGDGAPVIIIGNTH